MRDNRIAPLFGAAPPHEIMRSSAVDKAPKNLRSQRATPHNAQLRIIGTTGKDPVARRVVVDPVGLGDDADALGLQAQGDDLALELLAGFLERADVSHVTSPCCFRARDHRGLDGDLEAGGDRRRTRSRAGAQRRMAAVRLSWL